MLRLVTTIDEIERSPVGAAIAGTSFVAWCATSRLVGTVHFGRRDSADAHVLTRLYAMATHPAFQRPLRRVVDGRTLTGIDDEAWSRMTTVLAARASASPGLFERQAVIVAPTLEGARTVALLPAFGPDDEYRVFTDAEEAYAWADPDHGESARIAVSALLDERQVSGDVLLRARAWIANHLRDAKVERCAEALGVPSRGLQRELARAATSFRDIVQQERVSAARERLVGGEAKVESIAREVGCSSASQLGVLLRRAGLPSPSELRKQRKSR